MHSIMFVFKRKKGMSLEEFHHHYEHTHANISRRLPGLVEYQQHPIRKAGIGDGAYASDFNAYDAISLYTFENPEAAEKAWLSEGGLALEEDTQLLIDTDDMLTLPVIRRRVFTNEK